MFYVGHRVLLELQHILVNLVHTKQWIENKDSNMEKQNLAVTSPSRVQS